MTLRWRDHGGPIAQDVVACEETCPTLEIEAEMVARVSGCVHGVESRPAEFEKLVVFDRLDLYSTGRLVAKRAYGYSRPIDERRDASDMIGVTMRYEDRAQIRGGPQDVFDVIRVWDRRIDHTRRAGSD